MKDHKLAAILFTDIVGYTRQMEENEEQTMKLLEKQRELIFPLVKEFGGEVIKEIGDGLLIMFHSANKAVRCAIAIQNLLKDEDLTIRAGIHIGDVIFEKGDVFGSAVNTAARIEPLADANGICISEDVRSQIRNQKDIHFASKGKMELKGVNQALEIFKILDEEEAIELNKVSVPLLKDLWQRKVLQVLIVYLIASYLIKLAVSTIVSSYLLSPNLVDLAWTILLSLIPSVLILTYFHGKRGISKWSKVELIGMPLNLGLSIVLLVLLFNGKDLSAQTSSLILENEDGEKIEKVILKNEFRKKIVLFNFENLSTNKDQDYLQFAVPFMLSQDLSQDIYISPINSFTFYEMQKNAGYADGVKLPIVLMKRIANKYHVNYFLTGNISYSNSNYTYNCKLYESKYAKLVSEFSVSGTDVFQLIDDLSKKIKIETGVPESHISESSDLPVAELFTNSLGSTKYFSQAIVEANENRLEEAIEFLNMATKEDPKFALAYLFLIQYNFDNNQMDETIQALVSVMGNIDRLSERNQFFAKFFSYTINKQPEKAIAVIKMLVEFYPDDLSGRITLATRYASANKILEAIQEYKTILTMDEEQYNILIRIGELYQNINVNDSALFYYQKYLTHFPKEAKSYQIMGRYYSSLGEYTLAAENYDKALLLSQQSERIPAMMDLARIDLYMGNFDKAAKECNKALTQCSSPNDSSLIYNMIKSVYMTLGKYDAALEAFHKEEMTSKRFMSTKNFLVNKAFTTNHYINAGENNKALKVLEEVGKELNPPLDKITSFGYLLAYARMGEADKVEQFVEDAEKLLISFGEANLKQYVNYSLGLMYEELGNYSLAIEQYQLALQIDPSNINYKLLLSACYRKQRNFEKAEELIGEILKLRPFSASVNYEAGFLYKELGQTDDAINYLLKAVDIWKDADDDYIKAKEARSILKELQEVS